jgi:hypothetical protein
MSDSNADDITVTASKSQNKELYGNHSTPSSQDPPEDKTSAVIALMRGKPKDGCHRRRSNKYCKWTLVRILLDSGSDKALVFVSKD